MMWQLKRDLNKIIECTPPGAWHAYARTAKPLRPRTRSARAA